MTSGPVTSRPMTNWINGPLPNFSRHELKCPTTGRVQMSALFSQALQKLREDFGMPIQVTSVCRTIEHQEVLRARGYNPHPRSLHLIENPFHKRAQGGPADTCAADVSIASYSPDVLRDFAALLVTTGWSCIWGFERKFVHIDLRASVVGLPFYFGSY